MEVKACVFTDAGKTRKINQDAVMIKVANTRRYGRISFVCICDGMGGLSKGEIASCKAIRAMENWFTQELSLMQNLEEEKLWETIERSLKRLIARVSGEIRRYGKHRGINLGTTLTAFLQIGTRFMTFNIGDSRIYMVDSRRAALKTKDQSVIQDKLDRGIVKPEEVMTDPERNILLQCVGTTLEVEPEVRHGILDRNTTVVACSDGFWRRLMEKEIHEKLCPQMCVSPEEMLKECQKLSRMVIERQEEDNISVAAMCLEF